ncbi:hypothetical protein SAMN05428947_109230 [Mucilaginibacter sp. OK283]|nr:hypothetical protein SAMN05428947_109230 [Mucilaginibacter sp. OK283]
MTKNQSKVFAYLLHSLLLQAPLHLNDDKFTIIP